MVLSPKDKKNVDLADRSYVLQELRSVGQSKPLEWIPSTHLYPDGNLCADRKRKISRIPQNEIWRATAVRGPLHTVDGWRYYARAIAALLSGNAHAARHLAYYAELRAVLSILASNGIIILNGINSVIDKSGKIHSMSSFPTHRMCWDVFEYWGTRPDSIVSILDSLCISNVSLTDCIKSYFSSPPISSIASNVIKEWGFDLAIGAEDRNERNNSSYQLNELVSINTEADEDKVFIYDVWKAFEPENYLLETHMLRKILNIINASYGRNKFSKAALDEGYKNLDARVQNFIKAEFINVSGDYPDLLLLKHAMKFLKPASAYSMLSRAAILLKISTSLVEKNFKQAVVSVHDNLDDWWRQFGYNCGFWGHGVEPDNMNDLWYDVEDSLNSLEKRFSSRFEFLHETSENIYRICEAERIALWSLCV